MDMVFQTHTQMHQDFVNQTTNHNNIMTHQRMMSENQSSSSKTFKRFLIGLGIGALTMVGVVAVASRLEK